MCYRKEFILTQNTMKSRFPKERDFFLQNDKTKTMKRIAIQGIKGSYHDMAAHYYFDHEDIELICCSTFEEVFDTVRNDSTVLGMTAIENTIAGSLLHNYELLCDSGLTIVDAPDQMLADQCELVRRTGLADWTGEPRCGARRLARSGRWWLNSHPVALMQCRDFLSHHPRLKVVEAEDTAGSAEIISRERLHGHAAICSKFAAPLYGMKVLEEGIETNKHNFTRFLVFSQPQRANLLRDIRKANKASLVFILPHEQGSLSQVLSIFSFYKMNLTKIQSLPLVGKEWQYMFYVDLGFDDYTRYSQSIDAITPLTQELKILGEYQDGRQTI